MRIVSEGQKNTETSLSQEKWLKEHYHPIWGLKGQELPRGLLRPAILKHWGLPDPEKTLSTAAARMSGLDE